MTRRIAYKNAYRFHLKADYSIDTPVRPEAAIHTNYLTLEAGGRLTIRAGYAWDGPCVPGVDTESFVRAALVHDALFQLIRAMRLEDIHREAIDALLKEICLEDGVGRLKSWYIHQMVRHFSLPFSDPALTHATAACAK